MDPDPFSLNSIFLSSASLHLSVLFFAVLAIVSLFYVFILSILRRALLYIEADELKKIEKSHPKVYGSLQKMYDRSKYLETLFSLAQLVFIILASASLFFLLNYYEFAVTNIVLYIILGLGLAGWFLPVKLMKSSSQWLLLAIKYCAGILKFLTPIANYLAPPPPTLPKADVSLEDLKTALPESENNTPTISNLNLYKQVLRFDKILIENVMRPKNEIMGIKSNYNFKEVLSKIESSNFSRLPVYDGSWNNILGIIHCKDLLPFTNEKKLDWNQYIRPIVYVQPTDLAQNVLRIFQHSKNHMAIVKNELGEIVGIVTLEDITEEIIGEIDDE